MIPIGYYPQPDGTVKFWNGDAWVDPMEHFDQVTTDYTDGWPELWAERCLANLAVDPILRIHRRAARKRWWRK